MDRIITSVLRRWLLFGILVFASYRVVAQSTLPPNYLAPQLLRLIPDTTLIVGDSNQVINVSKYFGSYNIGYDYRASFDYAASGLPPGMIFVSHSGLPPGAGDAFSEASAAIRGTPTTLGVYDVIVTATKCNAFQGCYETADTFAISVATSRPPTGKPLALVEPGYDCSSGYITFKTTGGDGTSIEFMAAGITGWTTDPVQQVSNELREADTLPPFTLMARQSGQVVTDTWDLDAACAGTPLRLTPNYECATGLISFTFNGGGNGSPITFTSPDVDFATPVSGHLYKVKQDVIDNPRPITIQAHQRGATVSYSFEFIEPCRIQLRQPIPDINFVPYVGNSLYYAITNFFSGPSQGAPRYEAFGLPDGFSLVGGVIIGASQLTGVYTVTVVATNDRALGSPSTTTTFTLTVEPPVPSPLTMAPPDYDCQTGAFRFNTTGGDGSPIEYMAIGITGWTTSPDQYVDEGLRTAADAQPLTLRARQSGQEVFYVWDIRAQCPVGDVSALRLVAPQYDCSSGAFTFNTTGGDGSPVEFMAIGITGWTGEPNQFVDVGLRTATDIQPLTLRARQSGREVFYVWDIRAICPVGSYRLAAPAELEAGLQVRVLRNPAVGETVDVDVTGAANQFLYLRIVDQQGRLISKTTIDQPALREQVTLRLGASPGVYLLQANTPSQRQTVRIVK